MDRAEPASSAVTGLCARAGARGGCAVCGGSGSSMLSARQFELGLYSGQPTHLQNAGDKRRRRRSGNCSASHSTRPLKGRLLNDLLRQVYCTVSRQESAPAGKSSWLSRLVLETECQLMIP